MAYLPKINPKTHRTKAAMAEAVNNSLREYENDVTKERKAEAAQAKKLEERMRIILEAQCADLNLYQENGSTTSSTWECRHYNPHGDSWVRMLQLAYLETKHEVTLTSLPQGRAQ